MNKPLITYIIIVIISFTNDKLHSECNNPNIKVDMVSLLHHFVSIYSWFGTFIFGYPEIHLFYVLAIIAGWNYFGNCVISEWYNNACKLDKNKNHKDIPYYIMSTITGSERQSYSYLIYAVVAIDIGLILCKYRHSIF
mgnify:FL=1|jgi:hypothetical protein|tara:strand:+ start:1633 stop:2046 length:414 start_codon:yes stop_codon:yes gene_type:complete